METRPKNQYLDFWQERYDSGETPWDLGGPAPFFRHWLANCPLEYYKPGTMAVPGCGRGHDAALFAAAGFETTGFDYAPGAVAAAQALYGDTIQGNALKWVQADWFHLDSLYNGHFDYILEHTCFCAINPKRRVQYVSVAHRLLKPGGKLLGIFWDIEDPEGPPFGVSIAALPSYFESAFEILSVEPIAPALRCRENGMEYFVIMQARICPL